MTPKDLLNDLGQIIYRRVDYMSAMEQDTGLGRVALANIKKSAFLTQQQANLLKGYCHNEAEKLEAAAQRLREIAKQL